MSEENYQRLDVDERIGYSINDIINDSISANFNVDGSDKSERANTPPLYTPKKSMFDILKITSKVMANKAWYTFWHFDLFESVDRCYPNEAYYSSLNSLLTAPGSHVINNLFVGSAFNAADYNWLKLNKIDIIVNVTPCISNYYPNDFQYENYEVTDLAYSSLLPFYQQFYQLVEDNADKRIFVHCFAGRSRSVSLILYYCMKKYKWSLDKGINYIKSRRDSININCKFIEEICEKDKNSESE